MKSDTSDKTDAKKQKMLGALLEELGVITAACKAAGISRECHYNWLKTDEEYAATVKDMPDICLDFAESELFKGIKEGNMTAIIFYLKTKGKCRGYIEKMQIDNHLDLTGAGGVIILPDNGRNPISDYTNAENSGDSSEDAGDTAAT